MIVLKFTKTSTSALAAHVDTLRAVTYLLRRAQLDVEYSQGFNPHIELGFSPPLPLGVESYAEYVSVKTKDVNVAERVNAVCPQGMSILREWDVQVNLAARINRAEYIFTANGIGDVVSQILVPNYTINYVEKGEVVHKDVSSRIFDACRIDKDNAKVLLSVGNENLRPDRLLLSLMAANGIDCDYKIVKTRAFVDEKEVDEYLDELQTRQKQ